ncbi:MAG: hypothetical protein HBSAPP02_08120 [Phycisphaerae bacterium]|nr:MAG: terpene cyclase/mutase family protein [Planctomycetia bacterium]GJQ25780.1 MAG: hypothetical protein HBSAPP02_08120 [Phycisphaerae bacterium]
MNRMRRWRRMTAVILALFLLFVGAPAQDGIFSAPAASFAAPTDLARHPPLVTPPTQAGIDKALKFLAARQASDGAFREQGGLGTYPVSMTALAGLALAGSGSTPTQGPYAPHLRKSLTFILRSAQRNGLICRAGEEEARSMYAHGFSMLFLAEVMGMEDDADRLNQIRFTLQKAVELTGRSQSNLGGWLYTPDMNGDEGSVTVTQVQGLRAARNAGIAVPKKVIDHAMEYLEKSVQPDGGIAYRVGMTGSRPPITAAAVACWFNAGQYNNPLALNALRYCKQNIGIGENRGGTWGHWFYAHLYYAQVNYLAGEETWKAYYPKVRDHLLATQNEDGSWDGDSVGHVYGTAIALMILQLPYNNLPIMQR